MKYTTLRKSQLNAGQRGVLRALRNPEPIFAERLRNAVMALSRADPRWLFWIEKNIHAHGATRADVIQIEQRAKTFTVAHYLFSEEQKAAIVQDESWQFDARGTLKYFLGSW